MYKRGFSLAEIAITMIIIAVIMLVSAPMIANKMKQKESNNQNSSMPAVQNRQGPDRVELMKMDYDNRFAQMEKRYNDQISQLQKQVQSIRFMDRMSCNVEGMLNDKGKVVPFEGNTNSEKMNQVRSDKNIKFVLVCESTLD